MNKLLTIAVLIAFAHCVCSTKLMQCDNVENCKTELGRVIDRDFKIAHTTAVARIVRRYIDVCRELINRNQQDTEYVENLRENIRDMKNQLERIHQTWNNDEELGKIVKHIREQVLKKDVLKSRNTTPMTDEELNKVFEEEEVKKTLIDTLRVLIDEMIFQLRESNEELKDKKIIIDDVTTQIDDLVRTVKTITKTDDDMRLKKLTETMKKLTEKLDNMRYTKTIDLENIEKIRKFL